MRAVIMSDTPVEKCQNIYWNLLQLHSSDGVTAPAYVREFWQTSRCDNCADFSTHRHDMQKILGEDTVNRILEYQSNEKDDEKATQAVVHYFYWHQKLLVDALDWKGKMYYYTFSQAERTLAAIGIISSGYALTRFAKGNLSRIKRNFETKQ